MDKVARLSPAARSELIRETAERIELTPSAVEKDFWVVWVLDKLFRSELLSDKIIFKGGTSLFKVFGLMRRG
jgi:predicted nucleotidyltransferase component of viral defense system